MHACIFQAVSITFFWPRPSGCRGGDVMRIGSGATAGDLTINFCSPGQRMVEALRTRAPAPSPHQIHPVLIKGAAGGLRVIITLACFHGIETSDAGRADYSFAATGDDDIGLARRILSNASMMALVEDARALTTPA